MPRFLFVDFPLGSPCGRPFDAEMQRAIVEAGLGLLETAAGPRTTVQAPYRWHRGEAWKAKIFTAEQPFLDGERLENWQQRKQRYRDQKADGAD